MPWLGPPPGLDLPWHQATGLNKEKTERALAAYAMKWRLAVRPKEMATGIRTAQAGPQDLESARTFAAYVPQQCVGSRRCPLVVAPSRYLGFEWRWQVTQADRYGMIC